MPLVLVTGGTGGLGRELVPRFAAAGYEVRVMSRRPKPAAVDHEWVQADLASGEGLEAAATGVDLLAHCATNNLPWGIRNTDVRGTERLLKAATGAGVPHVLYISIVGIDRIPLGYYKAKLAAEEAIEGSGVPYSILRATQFHTLMDDFLRMFSRVPLVLPLPKAFKFQPIETGEVADRMVEHAAKGPSGRLPDLGGPEVLTFGEMAKEWQRARGKQRPIVNVPLFGGVARGFKAGCNCTPEHAEGKVTWEQWLESKYGAA